MVDNKKGERFFGVSSFEEINLEKLKPESHQECFLCDFKFNMKIEHSLFLKHVFEFHNLIIEDFQNIFKLDKYITFWKNKFEKNPVASIIPGVKIDNTNQIYFVLSDLLKDDKHIRHQLKLEYTLEQQEKERTNPNFKRSCLFCKLIFEGTCIDFVKHLSIEHNYQLGKPENLVFIEEFINIIEDNLNRLKCLYCEKTFTSRTVLKEHMRKKLHKRINPENSFYDKFYIVNYLEPDKNWQLLQKEEDSLPLKLNSNSDSEWSDWEDKDEEILCFFCKYLNASFQNICEHMKHTHNFDFQYIINKLDFYHKIKLVNYIRRQMHIRKCINCDQQFNSNDILLNHLISNNHFQIPEIKVFDQPEYFFPTYENDTLLYFLEEIKENEG